MRLAAVACALAIVLFVGAVGAVVSQRSSVPMASPSPAQAASTEEQARAVITTLEERDASPTDASAAAPASSAEPKLTPAPTILAENTPAVAAAQPATTAQGPAAAAAPAAAPAATSASSCPGNPNALGVSRTVEIDTTGGPNFGSQHFANYDFLREGEVVLTFDDGPWQNNTPKVLAALNAHCTKAIFFPIGVHATYNPGILKQVAAAGHAVGSHTWCHQNLTKTKGTCEFRGKKESVEINGKDEIEKGISAVRWAVGGPTAPYFRFPTLQYPPELLTYLAQRNIAAFSTDWDSFDFKMRKPEQVRNAVLARLKKGGKGIVLMHDYQHATADAAMDLLNDLKANGYKIVFMKPKFPVKTLASYDEEITKLVGGSGGSGPPISSVIHTIE